MRFTIRTPNPDFCGIRCGIEFRNGLAYTDDPTAADYCRNLGYSVEEQDITGGPIKRPKRRDDE